MPNRRIAHIFFDLDHTLWDFDKNSALAFERVFKKFDIKLALPEFMDKYEPINLKYWRQYRVEAITKVELRRGRLLVVFRAFKMEVPLSVIDQLATSYMEELPVDNHLLKGAEEILEYLSAKYTLHIITNGFREVQHIKLHSSGIQKFFKTVTTSEEVGTKKPHPLIFERAMIKARAIPPRSMMIGDSLEADIIGAENAGMHTLFFNYRNEETDRSKLSIQDLLIIKYHL